VIADLLVVMLWAVSGAIAATPDGRWGWAMAPAATGLVSILVARAGGRRLLVPRRPEGWSALAIAWFGLSVWLASGDARAALLPVLCLAACGLFLLENRTAVLLHLLVTGASAAAVLGAMVDPRATLLPLFVPFTVLLVVSLAAIQHARVLQRLQDAARGGYLLAQQIPGFRGRTPGLPAAIAVVALTATTATLATFLLVPRFRWKPADGTGRSSALSQSGLTDRLSLATVLDLKLDPRVALRLRILEGSATVRPTLPMRVRGSAVDRLERAEWKSTVEGNLKPPGPDGWTRLRPGEAARPVRQSYVLEPHEVNVLFVIPEAVALRGPRAVAVDQNETVTLFHGAQDQKVLYEVVSDARPWNPSDFERAPRTPDPRFLQLPRIDPRIAALAAEIAGEATDAGRRAARIEDWLRTNCEYTLEFEAEGTGDAISGFLFESRAGFCVHFASAMAVMLRTLKIPCRVAQGLAGGEWSEREQSVLFRLSDAHAWVEVWLGAKAGWVPFDPTPNPLGRAEEDASWLAQRQSEPTSPFAGTAELPAAPRGSLGRIDLSRQAAWLKSAWEALERAWDTVLGKVVFAFALAVFMSLWAWRLLPPRERMRWRLSILGPAGIPLGFYEEFLALAANAGLRPATGETPYEFGKRIEERFPGAKAVPQAMYAVRFGGIDARVASENVRGVIEGMKAKRRT
jgi:transglutaminase-like putative cysteine protease